MRSDLPGRRIWATLFALPLVIPSYVGAFALLAAVGPRGPVVAALGPLGVDRLPELGGFVGAFLALTLFTYPYVYLVCAASMRGMDPSLEETARTLGRSSHQVFRRVTMPMLRPAVVAGSLLVSLYALHDFGAVSLMRYATFTQAIYLQYRGAFDRTPAAILSLALLLVAVVVVVAEQRARGRVRYHRSGSGARREPVIVPLGRWRGAAVGLSSVVVGAALVLPLGTLLLLSLRGGSDGVGLAETVTAAASSVLVSGLGAVAATALALPVAVLAVRHPGPLARAAERLSYAGYALPGLVVGLAFVFIAARGISGIYQSLPLLVLAYVVLFLPQATESTKAGLLQIDPRMEDASRTLGSGPLDALRRVVLPVLARPIGVGAALVFLTAMKELPATLLLRPTGFETLATQVWSASSVGLYSRAAVPALVIVGLSAIPVASLTGRLGTDHGRVG